MIKKRLTKDSYWSKNPERRRQLFFNFEDNFQEVDWVMVGTRRGKTGDFLTLFLIILCDPYRRVLEY